MLAVLLTVHLIACIALVIAVLLQRSEGGALGMGGGGTGGLISGRGAASVLVRTTMFLALVFFITSVSMTRLNAEVAKAPTELEKTIQQQGTGQFNPLTPPATTPGTATPGATPPASTPAPAPVPIDPLAPVVTPPSSTTAPASTPPASTPAPAPSTSTTTTPARPPAATAPSQPAPAQPTPTTPAPGGTPNQ